MIYVLDQKYENLVYPCKTHFYYMKVGCKGVLVTRTCYHDELLSTGECNIDGNTPSELSTLQI